jgi:hypothetical protein
LISNDSEFFSTQLSVDVADPGATATFTLESGELPYGLELSSTGLISGYPVAKKSVTLTDKSVVYYGAVDVNGNPTTKLSKFQVKATTDSGSAVGNFSIGVVNQEAAWAENNTIPFPGRAPVLLNNKPLSTTISNSDPYYSYYFTGSSLGKFTQDNGFLFKINGYNFNQLNVPSGNTESNLTYSITGLREGNVTETSAFSKLISPTSNNANAVNGWINGTLNYIGADIKTYNFNVNISTPNLSSISTNATFTSNTSNITVSDISELRVSQKILFDSTVSANLMANTLYSISNINGNVIQISTVSTNVNVGTITGNANPTISTSDLLLLTANASFVNNNDNILISNANMTSLKVGQHVVFNANVSSNVTANTQYAIAGINGSNIQIATVPSIVNVGNITGNNHAVMSSTDLVPLSTGNIPLSFIVGGSINSNVGWSDTGDLGIIYNGAISEIVLTAAFSDQITDGRFKIIDGSLPPNLRLLGSGEIAGRVAFQNTSVAQSPNSSTTYTFTVRAYSKQYPEVKSDKTYTLTVVQKYTEPYDNIYVSGLLSTDQRSIVNGMISDIDTNYSSDIYRNGDSYFGLTTGVKYLHMYGVPSITSNDFFSAYNVAIATNHSLKNLTLGALKTAVARDDSGTIIYEVIYSEVIDTLANNGTSINEIVSTTAGTQYPNSLTNMRNQIKSKIGFIDDSSLMPRWMRSQQLDGSVYGYTPCWVICYTKPGKSAEIVNAINTYLTSVEYSLNNINFAMDRLEVDRSMTSTYGTTADYVWPSFTAQLIKDSANIRVNSLSGITMNQPVKLSGNVGSTGYSLGSTYYITAIDNDNSYTTNAIGNIHTTLTSNIVTGYNTKFTKDLQTGQLLLSVSNEKIGIVSMINSDSNLMLTGLAQVGITNISNSAEVGMKFNKEIHANSKTIQLRLNQNSSGNTAIVAADDGNVTLITTPLSAGTDNNSKDSYVMFTGNSTI